MLNIENQFINALLLKIEYDASEIENIAVDMRKEENFIIQALQVNSLVAGFLTKEELSKDRIALIISLVVVKHKNFIKEKLQEEQFYFNYISQKIKNGELEDKETYINKVFLSNEDNVMKIINEVGYFKLKYLNDNLKDKEHIVHLFCNNLKLNQIWASERIKQEAIEGNAEVFQYVKTKLYYKEMNQKFPNKPELKRTKI